MVKIHLLEVRQKKRMSTRALAQESGVSRSQIRRIEAGTASPTIDTLYKLAKALDVPVNKLFSCE